MSKVIQIFMHADLRCSHDGLSEMAKKQGINVDTLENGQYVIFINTLKNRLKMYAANNVLAYLKLKTGSIDLRTISLIPGAFNASGKIEYDKILKEVIEEHLKRKTG